MGECIGPHSSIIVAPSLKTYFLYLLYILIVLSGLSKRVGEHPVLAVRGLVHDDDDS